MAPLLVLHVSDLHFGPHSRFAAADPAELGKRFFGELNRARTAAKLGAVDLVIVTGDVTEGAAKKEFDQAQRFFEALVGELGLERRRFCFVPGNHDVSWAHCKRVRINQEIEEFDDDELERRLHTEKMVPWNQFLDGFHAELEPGMRRALGRGAFVHDFPELRTSVATIDSCTRETERDHGGFLGEPQAQALMSEWNREDRRAWLKLVAVHHNPVADNEDNLRAWVEWMGSQAEAKALSRSAIEHFAADATGFDGKARLQAIVEDTQAQLVLHGHVHAAGHTAWSWRRGIKGQTQVIGAGSWGLLANKLPGEQPVMFQLLVLDPEQREVRVLRRVWEPRARASGQVELGTFVDDPASPAGGIVLDVGLPPDYAPAPAAAASPTPLDRSFLAEYRTRLRGRHRVWELGAVHMGARRPATPALDDMYVPLRFGSGVGRRAADSIAAETGSLRDRDDSKQSGDVITPYRILQRHRNLLIRGPAGSGKTTWMRWSFRRLLEREDALPILIELRELARQWSLPGATGKQRNFDWWLSQWVERFVGGGWADALAAALSAKTGPRPILMVDGWDELGDLGREFREQFDGFLAAHPRVLAIATSRPYGEQVPEHDERFETVEVQPLSNAEIGQLVRLFFARVHEGSEAEVSEDVERFLRALDAAEQAKSLGRTPLLLVMMLIIGRGRPLPDRRHKLYEFCIEQLLDAHPSKRVQDGVQMASWQWAPEGYDARLRAVAKLALWMHENRGAGLASRAVVAKRDDLLEQLPQEWAPSDKQGFLAWLVASAGLMVDFSDEALAFAHLGFQEYLAAWQLEVDAEGDAARIALAQRLSDDVGWWETLRLWAALVEGRALERLEPVLGELLGAGAAGYWLAGAIFADGMGAPVFERWLTGFPEQFEVGGAAYRRLCSTAWAVSRQADRRQRIAEVANAVTHDRWDRWERMLQLARTLKFDLHFPPTSTMVGTIARTINRVGDEARRVAWGRVRLASSPLWPAPELELLALRLWPTRRLWCGWLMQTAHAVGASVQALETAKWSSMMHAPDEHSEFERRAATKGLLMLAKQQRLEHGRLRLLERCRYAEGGPFRSLAIDDSYHFNSLDREHELLDAKQLVGFLAHDYARKLTADTMVAAHSTVDELADTLGQRGAAWTAALAECLLWSSGFAGVRAMFAQALDEHPLVELLGHACRLSFANAKPDAELERRLAKFGGDPLWPALARHLVRAATPDDRALLDSLAADPDQRDGQLGLALRYWIRGDIMLADGSVRTLDELGVTLPLLDDLPPELELMDHE